MALIDSVRRLQEKGVEDREIARMLREEGFSPKEVINAISQSKIKAAVEADPQESESPPENQMPQSPQYSQYPQQEMQAQQYPQQEVQMPQYPQQDYSQYQQGYAYSPAPAYPQDSESLKEIAEETAEEKVAELREKISSLSQSKKEDDSARQDMEKRIKQLEGSFMQLQSAILGKISDYSKDLRNMTDEMHATQETFKKVLNPAIDKIRETKSKKKK